MADAPISEEYKNVNIIPESILGIESGTSLHRKAVENLRKETHPESPEKALEFLKAEGMKPLQEADIDAAVDRQISADRKADGTEERDAANKKIRNGVNKNNFDKARENMMKANTLLKDFRTLPDTQIDQIYGRIQGMLTIAFPEAADAMKSATTLQKKKEVLENIFQNPDFARTLHGKLEGLINMEPPKPPTELANKLADAKKELDEKTIEFTNRKRERQSVEKKTLEFDKSAPGSGDKQREIEKLESEDWEKKVSEFRIEVDSLTTRIARLNQELTLDKAAANQGVKINQDNKGNITQNLPSVGQDRVDALRGEIKSAEEALETKKKSLGEAEEKVKRLEALKKEKTETEQEFKKAKEVEDIAKAAKEAADSKYRNIHIEMDELKLGVKEADFLNQADKVVEESVREFLAKQVQESNTKLTELQEEAAKNEKDERLKEVDLKLKERWHKKGRTNKKLVEGDLQALLQDENAFRRNLGISEEVWKDKKDEAIASLLGYRINMGGLPSNEGWMIFNRYGQEMFENAQKEKDKFNAWMENAQKNGWIKGGGFEGFMNFVKSNPGMLLVLLALVVGAGAQVLAPGRSASQLLLSGKDKGLDFLKTHK